MPARHGPTDTAIGEGTPAAAGRRSRRRGGVKKGGDPPCLLSLPRLPGRLAVRTTRVRARGPMAAGWFSSISRAGRSGGLGPGRTGTPPFFTPLWRRRNNRRRGGREMALLLASHREVRLPVGERRQRQVSKGFVLAERRAILFRARGKRPCFLLFSWRSIEPTVQRVH